MASEISGCKQRKRAAKAAAFFNARLLDHLHLVQAVQQG
jgi:hypothetical protein